LGRWLNNLKRVYIKLQQPHDALTIIRFLRIVRPDSVEEIRDEGLYLGRNRAYRECIERLELYLKLLPNADDAEDVREILSLARSAWLEKTMNATD
jgi:regulator of sirC expression with transglutaminase-like and TPR domain